MFTVVTLSSLEADIAMNSPITNALFAWGETDWHRGDSPLSSMQPASAGGSSPASRLVHWLVRWGSSLATLL